MTRQQDNSHTPNGDRQVTCPECGIVFRTDHWLTKYCSRTCYKRHHNRKYYNTHQPEIKKRMKAYMREKRSE